MANLGKIGFGTATPRYAGNGSRLGISATAVHIDPIMDTLNGDKEAHALIVTNTLTAKGTAKFTGNTGLVAGTGISAVAGAHTSWVEYLGGIIKTTVLIDLVGLASGQAAGDIIGKDGAVANCHIGQYTVAAMGTLQSIQLTHLELAAGGDPDINLVSADEATLAENTALSAGTNGVTIINGGDGTATDNTKLSARTLATADQYFYLSNGAATDAAYTAGRLLIEFYGVA